MVEETMMVTDWDDLVLDAVDLDSLFDQIPNNNNNNNHDENEGLDELEHFLLNDDHLLNDENQFFNDIFLAADSPPIPIVEDAPKSLSSSDLSDEDDLRSHNQKKDAPAVVVIDDQSQQKEDNEVDDEDNSHDDDPLTKKRKRQLRNKDAALRSRERKKSYVKELEMKSRYYEAECRRLGSMLQCFMAENQALRFSLHSSKLTFDTTSITKQESAVLFLESLLLGSLLWLMAVVCQLLVLPSQLAEVTVVEEKNLPSPVLRKGPSKASIQILMVGKRFKASRSRMRPALDSPLQVVNNILLAVF